MDVVLDGVDLISRSGPDTYYIASNNKITSEQLEKIVAEIKRNLSKNIKKDQANEQDVRLGSSCGPL
jgi:uncharacterized HAD superfamily protein